VNRPQRFYVVECRCSDDAKKMGGWFQFHAGRNKRYARRMYRQAQKTYSHWACLDVRLTVWARPTTPGTIGWLSERRP
jgi:hypothetical protein